MEPGPPSKAGSSASNGFILQQKETRKFESSTVYLTSCVLPVNRYSIFWVTEDGYTLPEAAFAEADLANPPHWYQEDGGQCHGPAQGVCPIWVHVPAVKP